MIARIWHGWTKPGNADAYEKLLLEVVEGGDHSFVLPKSFKASEKNVCDGVLKRTIAWLRRTI